MKNLKLQILLISGMLLLYDVFNFPFRHQTGLSLMVHVGANLSLISLLYLLYKNRFNEQRREFLFSLYLPAMCLALTILALNEVFYFGHKEVAICLATFAIFLIFVWSGFVSYKAYVKSIAIG